MNRTNMIVTALLGLVTSAGLAHAQLCDPAQSPAPSPDDQSAQLVAHLERAVFQSLAPQHQAMIERGLSRRAEAGLVALCFADGTSTQTVEAFRRGLPRLFGNDEQGGFGERFNAITRWESTATQPTINLGEPATITWSFVPDGTILPNEYGEGDLPSELFAWMNTVYPAGITQWKPLFDSIFARWSEVSGLNFIYEPADDGAAFPGSPGALGVRGDVRISAKNIDGNSGILAYNYFPQLGDMVINSFDTFYDNTSNNSLRLRNVLQHEVGHGIGLAHVCPIQNNKLMEPFVSTAYDGVRHDDIRAAHFNYGDAFEPNNALASATNLGPIAASVVTVGAVPSPVVANGSTVALTGDSDLDWYTFSLAAPGVLSVELAHIGFSYDDASQNGGQCPFSGSCCFNDFADSGTTPLSLSLAGSSGNFIAGFFDLVEGTRTLRQQLPAGTYGLRVSSSGSGNSAQLYQLRLSATPTPLILEHTQPNLLPPSNPELLVQVRNGTQSVNFAQVRLFARAGSSGPFVQSAMSAQPFSNNFVASLPAAPCPARFEYYFEATSTSGTTLRLPADATVFTSFVGVSQVVFTDDFETDLAWTVGPNTATVGFWERGVPIGTFAQPDSDTSPLGINCYFTGQSTAFGEAAGTNDVDGGSTLLTSPVLNLAGRVGVRVSYRRWYSNVAGGAVGQDAFRAQVSVNNGSTWTDAEVLGPGPSDSIDLQAGWRSSSWLLPAGLAPSATTRIRFIADDANAGTVVEAAIDDLVVTALGCGPTCDSIDFNTDTSFFDPQDIEAFLSVYAEGPCVPATATCGDIDFNNDTSIFDPCDIASFLTVYAEGPCTPCGQ